MYENESSCMKKREAFVLSPFIMDFLLERFRRLVSFLFGKEVFKTKVRFSPAFGSQIYCNICQSFLTTEAVYQIRAAMHASTVWHHMHLLKQGFDLQTRGKNENEVEITSSKELLDFSKFLQMCCMDVQSVFLGVHTVARQFTGFY